MTKTKKELGQFFTTNADFILQGFEKFVKSKKVCDPFAGNRDLFNWAKKNSCAEIFGFDLDETLCDEKSVLKNDSINSPKKYHFVLTNPPYLHKNKADPKTKKMFFSGNKKIFEDLYQVSIFSLLESQEGILIVPLNFLSAENSQKIRDLFFAHFEICACNIFNNPVFADTTYNVISFYFRRKKQFSPRNKFLAKILPENKKIEINLEQKFGWQMGGEFLTKIRATRNELKIFRLTENFLESGDQQIRVAVQNFSDIKNINIDRQTKNKIQKNILLLRAIDSKNGKKIQLENIQNYKLDALAGKLTSRNLAHLIFEKEISPNEQKALMKKFNEVLNSERRKYNSLFLTNFRDHNRKRISFDFAYKLLNFIYQQQNAAQSSLF